MSRLADLWEARHLLEARTLLGALGDRLPVLERADAGRLRAACVRLVWSLARVLRVADSRGERLGRSDEREAARLEMAWVLLGHARDLLTTGHGEPSQLRYVVPRLAECLAEAVAVADARAVLLAAPDDDPPDDDPPDGDPPDGDPPDGDPPDGDPPDGDGGEPGGGGRRCGKGGGR
ncbi:hypothetical protein RKE29_00240 [Streptomyces sp. B1866]|uniref:hypothetical protein n=1 Tax=Streptomyces sp. B1866 TaxID=3075431 RepID=UPI00288D3753|nr:hypothetical protein [Streptomyces sp. B1866]MDT3395100.1 hypothetical protein [Streptomyces sp. B1866]